MEEQVGMYVSGQYLINHKIKPRGNTLGKHMFWDRKEKTWTPNLYFCSACLEVAYMPDAHFQELFRFCPYCGNDMHIIPRKKAYKIEHESTS